MWQREFINQQTYLNTQDTVFEVLSKTPEHILCQNPDAVKIDMLLKQSQSAEPDAEFGVKLVPYRNMMSGVIIDPNSNKNYSRNVALAIAFIAADRDDWQRFIPVGLKARELSLKIKREAQIMSQQNQPFKMKKKKDEGEEEFLTVERDAQDDYDSSSEESTARNEKNDFWDSKEEEEEDGDEDDDGDQPCKIFDHSTKQWRVPTANESFDLGDTMPKDTTKEKDEAQNKALEDRVAKVLQEQEKRTQEEEHTLLSDKIRRQVASLNDPLSQENASEMTQRFRGANGGFDLDRERQKVMERNCGVKSEGDDSGTSLLDRFAPEPEKPKAPQYTLQQLMDFGSKTKPPPSVQRILDQKNNVMPMKTTTTTTTTGLAAVAPENKNLSEILSKIAAKYKAICRKRLELATLELELEELLQ